MSHLKTTTTPPYSYRSRIFKAMRSVQIMKLYVGEWGAFFPLFVYSLFIGIKINIKSITGGYYL